MYIFVFIFEIFWINYYVNIGNVWCITLYLNCIFYIIFCVSQGSDSPIIMQREYYVIFNCDYELTMYPFDTQVHTPFSGKNQFPPWNFVRHSVNCNSDTWFFIKHVNWKYELTMYPFDTQVTVITWLQIVFSFWHPWLKYKLITP